MPDRKPRNPIRAGRPVRGSKTGRPVMVLLDLLGRRWAMRVLWELRGGRQSFRGLQEACGGISPAVLNQRLRDLRDAKLVDLADGDGYGLTTAGRDLVRRFSSIDTWAERWARGLG